MANKLNKSNMIKRDEDKSEYSKFEKRQKRLNMGARIMAIVVSLAMIVTAFLSSGVFFR